MVLPGQTSTDEEREQILEKLAYKYLRLAIDEYFKSELSLPYKWQRALRKGTAHYIRILHSAGNGAQ